MKKSPPPPPRKPGAGAGAGAGADSDDLNWVEKFTADNVAYYYNTASESVSWDKPNSLKTADEKERDQGEWVWISDAKEAWLPAMVKSRSGDSVTVVCPIVLCRERNFHCLIFFLCRFWKTNRRRLSLLDLLSPFGP